MDWIKDILASDWLKSVFTVLGVGSVPAGVVFWVLFKRRIKNEDSKLQKDTYMNQQAIIQNATDRLYQVEDRIIRLSSQKNVAIIDLLELIHISEQHFIKCENPEQEFQRLVERLKVKYDGRKGS